MENSIIDCIIKRSSTRQFTDEQPSDEIITTIMKAGLQAPFVAQMYSVILDRKGDIPFGAPIRFIFCVDAHKLELIMKKRGWELNANDLNLLFSGIQDVAYVAQNMVIAAESLGLGSCFLGMVPFKASNIKEKYSLPERVFPVVELVMGYPVNKHQARPRYPLEFAFFEDRYPELGEEEINSAMETIDKMYLEQGYYRDHNSMIKIEDEKKEETYNYESYSWTEHNARRWGQRQKANTELYRQLEICGFKFEDELSKK